MTGPRFTPSQIVKVFPRDTVKETKAAKKNSGTGAPIEGEPPWVEVFRQAGLNPQGPQPTDKGTLYEMLCPRDHAHTEKGHATAAFAAFWQDKELRWMECRHGHCAGFTTEDFVNLFRNLGHTTPGFRVPKIEDAPLSEDQQDSLGDLFQGDQVVDLAHRGTEGALTRFLVSAEDLANLDIPPREYAVEPWLPMNGVSLCHGYRGTIKTWLGMYIAGCVSKGIPCFSYKVPQPRTVWIVDGEMPLVVLKERCRLLWGAQPKRLWFLPSEMLFREGVRLNLNSDEGQAWFLNLLDESKGTGQHPDLIIFDNRSTLLLGRKANDNDEVDNIIDFDLKLRFRGHASLWFEHEGKDSNKGSRGASRAEDDMDYILALKKTPSGIQMTFTKTRGIEPQPDRLLIRIESYFKQDSLGNLIPRIRLTCGETEEAAVIPLYIRQLLVLHRNAPRTNKDLAALLGVSAQAAGKTVKQLRERGLVKLATLELTPKAIRMMSDYADWEEAS